MQAGRRLRMQQDEECIEVWPRTRGRRGLLLPDTPPFPLKRADACLPPAPTGKDEPLGTPESICSPPTECVVGTNSGPHCRSKAPLGLEDCSLALTTCMQNQSFRGNKKEMLGKIVAASLHVDFSATSQLLPTPAKLHCTFNLRDISRILEGLLIIKPASLSKGAAAKELYLRPRTCELLRLFCDRRIDEKNMWSSSSRSKHGLNLDTFSFAVEHVKRMWRVWKQQGPQVPCVGGREGARKSLVRLAGYVSGLEGLPVSHDTVDWISQFRTKKGRISYAKSISCSEGSKFAMSLAKKLPEVPEGRRRHELDMEKRELVHKEISSMPDAIKEIRGSLVGVSNMAAAPSPIDGKGESPPLPSKRKLSPSLMAGGVGILVGMVVGLIAWRRKA